VEQLLALWGVYPIWDGRESKRFLSGSGFEDPVIQHFPHFAGERRWRIRFGQELNPGVQHAVVRDGASV